MLQKGFFIIFFLLAVTTLSPSQGQCEKWKEFFKDGDATWQYDKDSIHYPITKKNILSLTVRNKEIVNVWVRWIDKKFYGPAFLVTIYCADRECDGCISMPIRGNREHIEPGSNDESLLKKVCP